MIAINPIIRLPEVTTLCADQPIIPENRKKGGPKTSLRIQTTRFVVFSILSPYGYDLEKGARADLQGFKALPDI